jgi:hypothetical protein
VAEVPGDAVQAAAEAIMLAQNAHDDEPERREANRLATVALQAAAPVLAEHAARAVLAHMESFGPRKPAGALEPVTDTGRQYRTWRRHFGIAARVAAGAFSTREDKLREAAQALTGGDYAACRTREDDDA